MVKALLNDKRPCMGRGPVGGAEVARGTSCKHGSRIIDTIYDGKDRERYRHREKHHSYDLT